MINLMVIFRLTHLPTCGWSILSHVLESLRHGRIVRASVQGSQLHHVVHQVDDGVQPGHLLLQLPGVLSQIKTRLNIKIKIISSVFSSKIFHLLSHVPHVLLLCFASINCLQQTGGLTSQLNENQHQLLLTLVEQVPRRDVGKVAAKFLQMKNKSTPC